MPVLVPILALPQGAVSGTPAPLPGPPPPPTSNPSAIYEGLVNQRNVLRSQLDDLSELRQEVRREMNSAVGDVDKTGLEQRLNGVDVRIAQVTIQLAEVDAKVAVAAGVPGAIVDTPPPFEPGNRDELIAMGIAFGTLLSLPIIIAYARRIWNRGGAAPAALPQDVSERIRAMERSLDAVAVEVERIGEGQRFVTQLLAARAEEAKVALPASRDRAEPRTP